MWRTQLAELYTDLLLYYNVDTIVNLTSKQFKTIISRFFIEIVFVKLNTYILVSFLGL